ncbi:hypothetical protein [Burkholderia territorii]|uniref:hypothetical protein n=1 Tax=Burkholderia territorii TaxID=1503055 RepID=UPI00075AEA4C|nr:hypothetical protein [Burkholderia territorii]KWO62541.1 hypothetical protein WT98_30185 [Burkholderia territorii]
MNADQKLKLSAMRMKFVAAMLLFGLWTALVFFKGVDPRDLIFAIVGALTGLGVYHTATNRSAPSSAVADLVAGIQASVDPELTASDPAPAPVVVPVQPVATAPATVAQPTVAVQVAVPQPVPVPTLQ